MKKTRLLAFLLLLAVAFSFAGCGEVEETQKPTALYTYTVMGEGKNATVALSKYTGNAAKVVVPSEYNGMPVTTIGAHCYSFHTEITEITIPDSISSIGDFAFQRLEKLERVELPDSVLNMGQGVFAECAGLKSVKLPLNLTVIPERAFADTGLESVEIGGQVKTIEKYAFDGCKALKSIVVPESVTSFGDGVFADCAGMVDMTFGANVIEGGFRKIFSKGQDEDGVLPQPVSICITSGESLPRDVFAGCLKLEKITFPDTMIEIGEMALMNCLALKEVHLPKNLKVLRESVFQNCESLVNISLPEGLEEIEIFSFAGCFALKEVVAPATVTKIDEMVFEDASLMKETVIVCPAGSAMEKYAKKNGFRAAMCKSTLLYFWKNVI